MKTIDQDDCSTSQSRRSFFKKTASWLTGAGLAFQNGGMTSASELKARSREKEHASSNQLKIKEYRILGRTGFRVSDLSCGSIQDAGLLERAFESGMNYVDTAEQYPGHHRILGKAIKNFDRKKIFITTKLEVNEDKSKEGFIKRTRKALEEIETDYVDCMMMHMPEKSETLKTEGFHEAMRELKAEGRVRFVGVSHHGSFWFRDPEETMEKVLSKAAEDGRFDVFLMAYNFLRYDRAEHVLDVCREKNIGVALMKTKPIAIYELLKERIDALEKQNKEVHPLYAEGLKRYKEKFEAAQEFIRRYHLTNPEEIKKAAIKFVLSNPNVSTVCCLARTYPELDNFIALSGTRLEEVDKNKLDNYRDGCSELYCRHACGVCEPACPHQVPVNTIMRYQQYFAGQGREKEAIQLYYRIPGARADACSNCAAPCEQACPYNIPVQGMLCVAHSVLSLE